MVDAMKLRAAITQHVHQNINVGPKSHYERRESIPKHVEALLPAPCCLLRRTVRATNDPLNRSQTPSSIIHQRTAVKNSPTAAFLLLVQKINATTKKMLSAQRMMFAIFPRLVEVVNELVNPTRGMPHSGLMPMGAETGSDERFERVEFENFWSWGFAIIVRD